MPKWNSTNTTAQSNFFQLQQLTKHMTPMGHVLKSFQCSCYRFVPFCRFFPATPIKASQRIEHVFDQVAICPANFRLFEPYQVIYFAFFATPCILNRTSKQQTRECSGTKNPMVSRTPLGGDGFDSRMDKGDTEAPVNCVTSIEVINSY